MAILVPYDGSHPAQKAVKHAVSTGTDEEIILLRVLEVASGSIEAGFELVQEKLMEMEEGEAAELSEELEALLDAENVEFRIETVVGKPAREIVSYAEENDVSHIVLGSHGRKGASRVLLGSVAETVVRRAPTTVTVVR
ncbi:universal stress protein [Halomontanus rarus]|uniref:universal stress protein n=1 Tax=Halomontanus rarus TaxID=3034020 RepID=UPI0023E880B2|nr:universal stress protein [Halovivax sp. TS33]